MPLVPLRPLTFTLPYTRSTAVPPPGHPPDMLLRPHLFVDLHGPGGNERVQGIVDSGADITSLPYEYAGLLGYAASDLTRYTGRQAGPAALVYWQAQAPLQGSVAGLPRVQFELHPVFVEQAGMTLLGRLDFMRVWHVQIDELNQQFTLTLN